MRNFHLISKQIKPIKLVTIQLKYHQKIEFEYHFNNTTHQCYQ